MFLLLTCHGSTPFASVSRIWYESTGLLFDHTIALPDTTGLPSDNAATLPDSTALHENILTPPNLTRTDSTALRFEVGTPFIKSPLQLGKSAVIDLKNPPNTRTEARYDFQTGRYVFENKIGEQVVAIPFSMSPEEYMEYRSRQMQIDYFRARNALKGDTLLSTPRFSLRDIRKPQRATGNIFGEGGVQLTTRGTFEISTGIKRDVTDNPTLPQRARRRTTFDMGQDIRVNLNAKVGDKINFDINYDSEATFDMEARKIKLAYRGDEDEIIRHIEAGNVGMTTSNSLIDAGEALFGVKADLQFGKLRVNTLLSQQESETRVVNSQGGVQTTPFEFSADAYDENRHFFLGYHFRDTYDEALSGLPYVRSPITITRVEAWVTNRRGDYSQARNIVALADLGEHSVIHNPLWSPSGTETLPHNRANTLYDLLITRYAGAREMTETDRVFPPEMVSGRDYEKLENARLLDPSEYTLHPQLGYLTLRVPLQPDEVLAVAYEYTASGVAYQVGEFARDVGQETQEVPNTGNENRENGAEGENEPRGALFVKLLKPVSLSPSSYTWDLMMKNIYSLGTYVYRIERDRFRMDISYRSDSTGTWLNYLPGLPGSPGNGSGNGGDSGNGNNNGNGGDNGNDPTNKGIGSEQLLRMMNLDRLNERGDPYPDGLFDFLEGYTVDTENGCIIFPVVEPFGSHLRKRLGDDTLAERYLFQELYDSTRTVARQYPERNRFRLNGEYRGSSGSEINLNAFNVPPGSVKVMAAGILLTEGTDYMVDYVSGTVNIINRSILDAGTPISVTLEDRSLSRMQRKTLTGIDLQYDFSKNLSFGTTLMHYREKPLVMKTVYGDESARNTLWGANLAYHKESLALTHLLDMLPFVEATQPSQLSTRLEFAQMIPGHYKDQHTGGYSYLDDFETSISGIDLRSPYAWSLAATPYNNGPEGLFPEAALSNNTDYGKNRARLAWFFIDGIFTRPNSSLTPPHIRNDLAQLSDHRVREVHEREIFPNREAYHGQPTTIPVLNLSYYPSERGPYNVDTDVDSDGMLMNPHQRWGGITRRLDIRDFEEANIEYIEFWLMDPFVNDTLGTAQGGDLYFNLGNISEDVLKDGKKFFENGLPVDGDTTAVGYTVWGKYPKRQSTVYAFDNSLGIESRRMQDVGLNGLSTEEEMKYPTYADYLEELRTKLSSETLSRMQNDTHSPLNDPAGDNFRHYRGAEQDQQRLSILDRYKHYNNTEGNSIAAEGDPYASAARNVPDVEDIDNDNTLNENESYYQYRVSLRPGTMEVGSNFITDKRETSVRLRDGSDGKVTWYQFKIPIREYQTKTGNIQGFNNIRFMRLFLTDFREATFLRFATLELIRGEWREYQRELVTGGALTGTGSLDVSAVNIEENGSRSPVNYVIPPGVSRVIDPGQPQLRQENEQSLSLKLTDLAPGEARAVYRNTAYDTRRHKRLQMFVHAEQVLDDPGTLQNGDLAIFLRLGSDYRDNYYEYEIPLHITPEGQYSTYNPIDQEAVWPNENRFDFPLELLTRLKLERDTDPEATGSHSTREPYSMTDPDKPANRVTIMGAPSLAEVSVMMIGVRNRSESHRSVEVWVNELRLSEFDDQGGWAAQGEAQLALSDMGTIHFSGRKETVGFGALSQQLMQRRNDDYQSLHFALNLELGRFLPKQANISAPLYYSYSDQLSTPLYDPFNQDIFLSESIHRVEDPLQRDSLRRLATTRTLNKSFSLSNVKVNIKSENPMPYDPANFSFTYANNVYSHRDPETEYATTKDQRLQAGYFYAPSVKLWQPFEKVKFIAFRPLPNHVQLRSNLTRRYQERQWRDLNTYAEGNTDQSTASSQRYLTFGSNFFWDRDFSFTWDLTSHLKASFRSGTVAQIEEPYLQVNKQVNRNDYEVWRDSVAHSIRKLGTPYRYEQSADVTYTLPLSYFSALDWMNASAAYHSQYRWERGAKTEDRKIGNYLQNDLSITLNSRFNLVSLYNKIPFLREANARFSNNGNHEEQYPPSQRGTLARDFGYHVAQAVMTVRSISMNISHKARTDIPGFDPMIGDLFGQHNTPDGLIPGLGFAFGLEGGERFIEKSLARGQLIIDPNHITPALYNKTEHFRVDATLEPFRGFKVELHGLYEDNQRTEFQYMVDGMPKIHGGSFAMSTLSLFSAFEGGRAGNNYRSKAFEQFLRNREVIAGRVEEQYKGDNDPDNNQLINNISNNTLYRSADVLIPSFLAAYTGQDPHKTALSPFPSIRSLLPNWNASYNLMTMMPKLQEHLRSLYLSHAYLSQYRVGSFSSFPTWVPLQEGSDFGFVRDPVTGAPLPSSRFNITSVAIVESFNPLMEINSVLNNQMNIALRLNKTRALNLSIGSYQIVETNENDMVLGIGYRLANFNRIIGFGSNSGFGFGSTQHDRRRASRAQIQTDNRSAMPFSNDLVLRLDVSRKITRSLIRKIEDGFTQATSGMQSTSIRFTADYSLSRKLTVRAYYDTIIHQPLVSSYSYPSTVSHAGINLRFDLGAM